MSQAIPSLALAAAFAFAFAFSLLVFLLFRRTHLSPLAVQWAPSPSRPAASPPSEEGAASAGDGGKQRRKRRRGRRKRREERGEGSDGGDDATGRDRTVEARPGFPFSSVASAMQRRIKSQYDELVRSNQAKSVTMAQIGQFINCLVEARNELQHKSEIIQRSFKIKKALLFKADRSSFDRLCQQVYKLEAEHKRLEEDAAVYNLLQEQLKLSPAYNTMLEISASMEAKAPAEPEPEPEPPDISFEELLAQEKKDSFWQRNGKLKSFAN